MYDKLKVRIFSGTVSRMFITRTSAAMMEAGVLLLIAGTERKFLCLECDNAKVG
ncbi:MAG: hypothetical protein HYY41_02925 [Chloroflexi bacterium]|nr:hypothetical protein [Chloroflexota bacterium]MBI2979765.1 hypothetical protein [Chloroflexota bacterium]